MKTKLLISAMFLFVGFGMQASAFKTDNSSINYYNNDYGDSFTFVERDVTFAIFQNGEFDFYINPRNQRSGLGVNYQGNGVNISFNSGYDYDMYVQYDSYGAIIQIENIPIYYDYYGRVNRIGNTHINYDSGRLVRVGGLHVYYDRQGYYSHYSGYINSYNRAYVFHPYHNYFARPLFDFRIVSYNPYRNHYQPTRYTYYSDHSRNKYYDKNYRRNGNDTRRRVAAKSVPNRYNDKNSHTERRNTNDRQDQNGRNNNTVNNNDRRKTTVNRPTSKERTSQNGNNTARRSNTVNRPTSNERTRQNGNNNDKRSNTVNRSTSNERTRQNGNNNDKRSNTVNRSTSNERSSQAGNNTAKRSNTVKNERSSNSGRIAENRAPVRTAKAPERVQQRNNTANTQKGQTARVSKSREASGNSGKKENSKGNSSRRN